ncbi:MAG: methyltransferase [Bacteroidales bacterium]|nr:methyltransferase [Bacteroidales bacterium]HPD95784.1 hypothetical protein [Tenuifilaceae bacterium]HRX31004.1 hypothetical protein [Tenuifilaceae bacterium]
MESEKLFKDVKNKYLLHRYIKTFQFIEKFTTKDELILDLGTENLFSNKLKGVGYNISNTEGQDFDIDYIVQNNRIVDVTFALEILEHLVSPFPLLTNLKSKKLIATVPLRLWFNTAYRHPKNEWDWHYHEFESWQFDWLLRKSGWKIIYTEKWNSPLTKVGVRPIIRALTPRYYAVYAERI